MWMDSQAVVSACSTVEGKILAWVSANFFVICNFLGLTLGFLHKSWEDMVSRMHGFSWLDYCLQMLDIDRGPILV
jgi:hypothetical protein